MCISPSKSEREHVVIDVEKNEFLDILLLRQFMQVDNLSEKIIKVALKLRNL